MAEEENQQEEKKEETAEAPKESPAEAPKEEEPKIEIVDEAGSKPAPDITGKKLDTIKKIIEMGESGGSTGPALGEGVQVVGSDSVEGEEASRGDDGGEKKPEGEGFFGKIFKDFDMKKAKPIFIMVAVVIGIALVISTGFRLYNLSGMAVEDTEVEEIEEHEEAVAEIEEEEPEESMEGARTKLSDYFNRKLFGDEGDEEGAVDAGVEVEPQYDEGQEEDITEESIEEAEEETEAESTEEDEEEAEEESTEEAEGDEVITAGDVVGYFKDKIVGLFK